MANNEKSYKQIDILDELLSSPEIENKKFSELVNPLRIAYINGHYALRILNSQILDARFLLQKIDTNPNTCQLKKLIMLTTNRFDFGLDGTDKADYYALIGRLNANQPKRVIWVQNNPWENRYMLLKMGPNTVPKPLLVRPFGFSSLQVTNSLPYNAASSACMYSHPFIEKFHEKAAKAGVNLVKLGWQYGGPTVLSKFKVFVDLPYQTSTMKMYENMAHGVVTMVPTPRFIRENLIPDTATVNFVNLYDTLKVGDDWFKYIEYFNDDFKEYFPYQFDSLEDLKFKIENFNDTFNIREKLPLAWKQENAKSLKLWKEVRK
ncbi:hypothetical protein HK099_005592 [Clydaea vesicula]|uniref:Uncharacterized protein n=1 Tax=Clydaea vesicula TaxID=447962 RepID=A0AAD5TYY2_9FUNG|nr:hypothetical protein HK099_005592 [Clydaea vesicula]